MKYRIFDSIKNSQYLPSALHGNSHLSRTQLIRHVSVATVLYTFVVTSRSLCVLLEPFGVAVTSGHLENIYARTFRHYRSLVWKSGTSDSRELPAGPDCKAAVEWELEQQQGTCVRAGSATECFRAVELQVILLSFVVVGLLPFIDAKEETRRSRKLTSNMLPIRKSRFVLPFNSFSVRFEAWQQGQWGGRSALEEAKRPLQLLPYKQNAVQSALRCTQRPLATQSALLQVYLP